MSSDYNPYDDPRSRPPANPYGNSQGSPPSSSPQPPPSSEPGTPITPGRMDISEAFMLALRVLKSHWLLGSCTAVLLWSLPFAASMATGFMGDVLYLIHEYIGSLIGLTLNYFLRFCCGFSGAWFGYIAVRATLYGEKLDFETVFNSFKRFKAMAIMSLLYWAILLAVSVPGIAALVAIYQTFVEPALTEALKLPNPGKEGFEQIILLFDRFALIFKRVLPMLLGAAALIGLPQFYVTLRLDFAWLICMERDDDVLQAMRESWILTRGNVGSLMGYYSLWFLLYSLLLPFFLVGLAITCMVGMVALIPLSFLHMIHIGVQYHALTRHMREEAKEKNQYQGPPLI